MSQEKQPGFSDVDRISSLLLCPYCSGEVRIQPGQALCFGCGAQYPIRDGVPLMARMGTSDTWEGARRREEADSQAYQEKYRELDQAAQYNADYKERPLKRMSTAREYWLLRSLLQSQGHSERILELPCGGGRLSAQIEPFTDLLVEADIAEGQVLYGKKNAPQDKPRIWMTASAFHIPFKNDSFDGTVCVRLCHHLPTENERERLMKELFRVSRRFVLMTFFDYHSLKNRLRRIRRPFNHKPSKATMTMDNVRRLARENGAELVACPALAILGSGHRYALMVKSRT